MPMSPYVRRLRETLGHELILLPSVSGVIFDDKGRVLVVLHAEGEVWGPPGGGIDPLERPTDAVIREVHEETGLDVEVARIIGVYGGPEFVVTYGNGDRTAYISTAYHCRIIGGSLKADGQEVLEARFVARAALSDLVLTPWGRHILPDAFRLVSSTPPSFHDNR